MVRTGDEKMRILKVTRQGAAQLTPRRILKLTQQRAAPDRGRSLESMNFVRKSGLSKFHRARQVDRRNALSI